MDQFPVSDESAPLVLDLAVKVALVSDEAIWLCLFVNDYTPDRPSTLADYVEPVGVWYQRRALMRDSWADATIVGHVAQIQNTGAPFEFSYTGPGETVYGVFLLGAVTNVVYYARRMAPPRVLVSGDPLSVSPVVTLESRTETT